jgi:hypothetical protein
MDVSAQAMSRVWGGWIALFFALLSAPLVARDVTPLTLARGARVGVINLLDSEVTHYHAAKSIKDTSLRTEPVGWSVADMLVDALKDRAAQMGLVLVPLAVTDELDRARESCFLNGNFNKSLPKDCVAPFQHLGTAERVEATIVLAPGVNNTAHAGSTRRKELPEYIRGWGFVTGDESSPDGKPTLFSMTEMLLIAPSTEGPVLRGREWGGSYSLEWSNFVAPANIKDIPAKNYNQLQPLFAGILARQAARLLDQIQVP